MNPEASQIVSLRQAAAMVSEPLMQQLATLNLPSQQTQGTRWQHAVTIASQVSLTVLDVLAPGHPALSAVDIFGHALSGVLGSAASTGSAQ